MYEDQTHVLRERSGAGSAQNKLMAKWMSRGRNRGDYETFNFLKRSVAVVDHV